MRGERGEYNLTALLKTFYKFNDCPLMCHHFSILMITFQLHMDPKWIICLEQLTNFMLYWNLKNPLSFWTVNVHKHCKLLLKTFLIGVIAVTEGSIFCVFNFHSQWGVTKVRGWASLSFIKATRSRFWIDGKKFWKTTASCLPITEHAIFWIVCSLLWILITLSK